MRVAVARLKVGFTEEERLHAAGERARISSFPWILPFGS